MRRQLALQSPLVLTLALALAACSGAPRPDPTAAAPPASPNPELTWVSGRSAADGAPVVVVLHGYGDSPNGILPLLDAYPDPIATWAPRGPLPKGAGASWLSSPALLQDPAAFCDEVRAAGDRIARDIQLLGFGDGGSPVAVTGFSQGGILSFELAFRHSDVVDLAVPIAGHIPGPCLPAGGPPSGAAPIRAVHGAADERLPLAPVAEATRRLQEQGWDIQLDTDPVAGHQVTRAMRGDLFGALQAALRP